MNPRLHELTDDYLAFSDMLEASDAEADADVLSAVLAKIQGGWLSKADNIGALISEFENNAEAIDDEIDRLKARKRVSEAKANWLRGYILNQMELVGQDHIRTTRFNLSRVQTEAVNLTNEEAVPGRFKTIVTTVKIDKRNVHKAIASGEEVPGAELVHNTHLRIT